jgi:hypothetical protein
LFADRNANAIRRRRSIRTIKARDFNHRALMLKTRRCAGTPRRASTQSISHRKLLFRSLLYFCQTFIFLKERVGPSGAQFGQKFDFGMLQLFEPERLSNGSLGLIGKRLTRHFKLRSPAFGNR